MKLFAPMLTLALAGVMFVSGCDKKKDGESNPVIPSFNVSLPLASFSDSCSAGAYTYALTVSGFASQVAIYSHLPSTSVSGTTTWTMTDEGVTSTLTAVKQSDGSYVWKLKLNGVDTSSHTTYTNWTAMEGTSSGDSKSGHLTIYSSDPTPSTAVEIVVDWSTAGATLSVEMQIPSESVKIVLSSNGTSGEVTLLGGPSYAALLFHATWATPGGVATCG